jgi:hypothetical protein
MSVDDLHGKGNSDPVEVTIGGIVGAVKKDTFAKLEAVSPGITKKISIFASDPIPKDVLDAMDEVARRKETH